MRHKNKFINIMKYCPVKWAFSPVYSGMGSILFMHKIVEKQSSNNRIELMMANEIDVEFLEEMLVFLKRKYDIISLDEMQSRLKNHKTNKKKFIVITFDDGYKDNLTLAYPVFKKHNVPFTVYITNGYPNKTAKLWWYMLEDVILENAEVKIQTPDKALKFDTSTKNKKAKAFDDIRRLIINQPDKDNAILNQLEENYGKNLKTYVEKEALSWDEVKKLSEDKLVTLGCHTMSHLALNKLSEDEILFEVLNSKRELEDKAGIQTHHFAYPYGTANEVNLREVNILESTQQFSTSVTTRMGNVFSEHLSHLHQLPRIQVLGNQQHVLILDMYLSGFLPALKNKFKKVVTL